MKTLQETYFKEEQDDNKGNIDEPKDGPLGKVVFSRNRKDKVEWEDDTGFEEKFYSALRSHYNHNMSEPLENMAPKIISLIDSGKYEIIAAPENKTVYRSLREVSVGMAAKIIGVSVKELRDPKAVDKAWYYYTNFNINPMLTKIQSWSLNPESALHFASKNVYELEKNDAVILAISNTNNGKFFMNPAFQNKVYRIDKHADEKEIISYGPVELEAAVVLVGGSDDGLRTSQIEKKIKQAMK